MAIKQSKTSTGKKTQPNRLPVYPFSALVGQEEMKLGLILNVIDPSIGGVLIMGHRGTGKSTAVRGLAELLPEVWVAKGCSYRCDPSDMSTACDACREQLASAGKVERERAQVTVVDLPLGATEDRVCGSIDIQRALAEGVRAFEPGLLARANRGFLYIDEVNLLEDHLVDLLLDVAVTGQNKVERENISVTHPARFVLIGSGNPEEGELRPQLLDRFGLDVEVKTETELDDRVEIVERREAFQRDEETFAAACAVQQAQLRKQIGAAQKRVGSIRVERPLLRKIAELCGELGIDGHRGELTITKAARALAAFEGKKKVGAAEIKRVTAMALRHRLRRDPLEERAESERIQQAIEKTFTETRMYRSGRPGDDGDQGGRAQNVGPDDGSSRRSSSDSRRVASANGTETAGDKTTSLPVTDRKDRDVRLPEMPPSRRDLRSDSPSKSNRRAGASSVRNHLHGRYVRATATRRDGSRVAVAATLRASVSSQVTQLKSSNHRISADSLRFQELSCKTGRLFIFAIDTSGSMALQRIKQAKIAVLSLLKQSYIQRDQVAIIGFRGESAEVCLPVSRSILRARRVLDSLRVGGGTPLSAGLACALKLTKAAGTKVGETSVLLFTDGNANVMVGSKLADRRVRREAIDQELAILGSAFRKARVSLIVVDTQNTFIRSGEAAVVARRLGAHYRSLKYTP